MWFLPSKGRPKSCQMVLDAMVDCGCIGAGVVYANEDDAQLPDYYALRLPHGWTVATVGPGVIGLAEKVRQSFRDYPDEDWYGLITDDTVPATFDFESRMIDAAGKWGIVSTDDGWKANADVRLGRMTGAAVFGGDLLRALGFWLPEEFVHLYVDDVWEFIGRELGVWTVLMDILVTHDHPWKDGREMDAITGAVNTPEMYASGQETYLRWRNNVAFCALYRANSMMMQSMPKLSAVANAIYNANSMPNGHGLLVVAPMERVTYCRLALAAMKEMAQ